MPGMSNCKSHVFSLALQKLNVCDIINSIQLSQNYDVNKSTPEVQYPLLQQRGESYL